MMLNIKLKKLFSQKKEIVDKMKRMSTEWVNTFAIERHFIYKKYKMNAYNMKKLN